MSSKFSLPEGFVDLINKGDFIDRQMINEILDGQPIDAMVACNLQTFLNKTFKKAGKPIVFRTKHTNRDEFLGIKALTDTEAVSFAATNAKGAMRKLRKTLNIHQAVDQSQLDDETKRNNEKGLAVASARYLAVRGINSRTVEALIVHQNRSVSPFKKTGTEAQ